MPVGDGQPTLRVTALTVGGTAGDERAARRRPPGRGPGAATGEQVEAYVARSKRDRACAPIEGEVESLTSAESSGVGVRVIVDKREGFAYAGTLDEGRDHRSTGRGPRQRASSARPTSGTGSPSPTASTPPELDLYRSELASFPTDGRSSWRSSSSAP